MGITRADKENEVKLIADGINASQMTVCVDYLGLTVAQVSDLRQQLAEAGAEAKVTKNTLAKIAVNEVLKDTSSEDLEKFVDLFTGPSLMVFGKEEAVGPAKVLAKFAKEHENLEVKGAWFSDAFLDAKGVVAVSKMPSREETLAKLLALLNTPAQQLMRLMNAPAQQVVQVIKAHEQKL